MDMTMTRTRWNDANHKLILFPQPVLWLQQFRFVNDSFQNFPINLKNTFFSRSLMAANRNDHQLVCQPPFWTMASSTPRHRRSTGPPSSRPSRSRLQLQPLPPCNRVAVERLRRPRWSWPRHRSSLQPKIRRLCWKMRLRRLDICRRWWKIRFQPGDWFLSFDYRIECLILKINTLETYTDGLQVRSERKIRSLP